MQWFQFAHSTPAALQAAVNKLTEKRSKIVEFGSKRANDDLIFASSAQKR
jgi:hypothetical protein